MSSFKDFGWQKLPSSRNVTSHVCNGGNTLQPISFTHPSIVTTTGRMLRSLVAQFYKSPLAQYPSSRLLDRFGARGGVRQPAHYGFIQ